MSGTEGLRRRPPVTDTGGPISMPVGEGVMGRVFDVIGQSRRRTRPGQGGEVSYPIHRPPPARQPGRRRLRCSDRHQGHRPHLSVPEGRQDRRLRRRRRRQDRRHHGTDQQHRQAPWRRLGVRGRRRADARGKRPLPRDVAGRSHQPEGPGSVQDRSRLRADERTPRRAPPCRAERPRHHRSFPRREENQDVLLFIDNIFRFSQAGSNVGAARPNGERDQLPAEALAAEIGVSQNDYVHQRVNRVVPGVYMHGRRPDDPRRRRRSRIWTRPSCFTCEIAGYGVLSGGRSAGVDVARVFPKNF